MKNNNLIVGRQPQVAFDAGAELQRGGEGDHAIFRKSGAGMKAPVREAHGTGI